MPNADILKTALSKGKTEAVLLALRAASSQGMHNEVIQLIAQYHEYRRKQRLGLGLASELRVELARIQASTLELIDGCVQDGITDFPDPNDFKVEADTGETQKGRTRRNWFAVALGLFLLLVAGLYFIWPNTPISAPNPADNATTRVDSNPAHPPDTSITHAPPARPRPGNRKFDILVFDSATNTAIDGAQVWVDAVVKPTQNGVAHFEMPLEKGRSIKIRVVKTGYKVWDEWLDPIEDSKEIRITKDEND